MTPPRRPQPVPAAAEVHDILPILVAQKLLTVEQAERARRAVRLNNQPVEQVVIQLGLASEIQIAQALAVHAGLRFAAVRGELHPLRLLQA